MCGNTDRLLEIFGGRRAGHVLRAGLGRRAISRSRQADSARRARDGLARLRPRPGLRPDAGGSSREDLRRAKARIEDACGVGSDAAIARRAFRCRRSLWALDVLVDEGYLYDSSIFPIRHDRYGIPAWPRHIHRDRARRDGGLWELPGSTVRHWAMNLPIGGGGYFRLLPYRWTQPGIRHLNEHRVAAGGVLPASVGNRPGPAAAECGPFSSSGTIATSSHGRAASPAAQDFRFGTVARSWPPSDDRAPART